MTDEAKTLRRTSLNSASEFATSLHCRALSMLVERSLRASFVTLVAFGYTMLQSTTRVVHKYWGLSPTVISIFFKSQRFLAPCIPEASYYLVIHLADNSILFFY